MSSIDWIALALLLLAVFGLYRFILACKRANVIDWDHYWVNIIDGFLRLYCGRYHRLNHARLEIPDNGPAIVVSNHVSGLDPLLLVSCSHRPLRFLIAREEYERFGLNWLFKAVGCIPVDREGRPERALRAALQALRADEVVALFPHGKIHLDSDPPRRLKPGAARLAQFSDCPMIPVRITGVRGQGHVMPALFLRSQANVTTYSVIKADGREIDEISSELAEILDGSRAQIPPTE